MGDKVEAREALQKLERKYSYIIPSIYIKVDEIVVNEETIQKNISERRLKLIDWIVGNEGQADPIYVFWNGQNWVLLYGLEELEVFKKRGLEMIEAKYLEGERKRIVTLLLKILESRKSLNPIELAENLEKLKEETGFTWNDISELTGISKQHIHKIRQVKNCPYEDIKEKVRTGQLSLREALREIKIRKAEERGQSYVSDETLSWEEQPFKCPICGNETQNAYTRRICLACYNKLKELYEQGLIQFEVDKMLQQEQQQQVNEETRKEVEELLDEWESEWK